MSMDYTLSDLLSLRLAPAVRARFNAFNDHLEEADMEQEKKEEKHDKSNS